MQFWWDGIGIGMYIMKIIDDHDIKFKVMKIENAQYGTTPNADGKEENHCINCSTLYLIS